MPGIFKTFCHKKLNPNIKMAFLKRDSKVKSNFSTITISLASPESIRERSGGGIKT
jgi:hypothetical protein